MQTPIPQLPGSLVRWADPLVGGSCRREQQGFFSISPEV